MGAERLGVGGPADRSSCGRDQDRRSLGAGNWPLLSFAAGGPGDAAYARAAGAICIHAPVIKHDAMKQAEAGDSSFACAYLPSRRIALG